MRDHVTTFAARSAVLPAVLSADPAPITIDRSGFNAVSFVFQLGAGGITFTSANRLDLYLEHSDDGVTWEAVGPTNVIGGVPDGSGIVLSQRSAHPDPTVHKFAYVDGTIGDRRYVRLRPDFIGTHGTGTPMSALAILGNPREQPVAA
ncbi:hypothetical protein ABEV34_04860 [Methylorubrum rhodesianum]|uniref:hypothetical protein n=1 Tax=Methylorubrum TaxID=2282523 RepID=UPI001E35BE08|nr:hypothetical protein [Methylorubrum sp. B1-46]UGB28679.1 hypothetical protein LPC10_25515 [Methylorubrum sp. B1-46]